jgi:hypothetical protein
MEVANDLHATCQKTSASMIAKIRKDCSGLAIILFFYAATSLDFGTSQCPWHQ